MASQPPAFDRQPSNAPREKKTRTLSQTPEQQAYMAEVARFVRRVQGSMDGGSAGGWRLAAACSCVTSPHSSLSLSTLLLDQQADQVCTVDAGQCDEGHDGRAVQDAAQGPRPGPLALSSLSSAR